MRRRWMVVLLAAALMILAGCGAVPTDPNGTLERTSGGVLRVGASPNGDFVTLSPTGEPEGSDVELIRDFAAGIDARVEWSTGAEHVLAERVERGELDVMIGGLRQDTPWEKHAALTQPYAETEDAHGKKHKHIMLAPKGENAFLLKLDAFLKEAQGGK